MKRRIILTSILMCLVAVTAILFGAVFRLRNQSVIVLGEQITISQDDIIKSANLAYGHSIFMLDKDKAIDNIENEYANLKVVQIKTTNVTSVEIIVRKRVETYYVEKYGYYYAMDEDLKILNKTTQENEVKNLINIKDIDLNITENTRVGQFVGKEVKDCLYNAYIGIFESATKTINGKQQYLTRAEVINFVEYVTIKNEANPNEGYKNLIIKTASGVMFEIGKPESELKNKINMCVSAYEKSGEINITKGSIKIYYAEDGTQQFKYFDE